MGVRFLIENLVDRSGTTLTASSSVTTLPVANLQNTIRQKVWRTTSITSQNIVVNFGGGLAVNVLAFVGHNFTRNATIILSSSNDNFVTTAYTDTVKVWGIYDMGFSSSIPDDLILDTSFIYYPSAAREEQYWKLAFTDASNPDGYFEVGRLFIGQYFEPTNPYEYDWELETIDPSLVDYSLENVPYADEKYTYHKLRFNLNNLTENERLMDIETLVNIGGFKKDIIVSLYPVMPTSKRLFTSMYGRLESSPAVIQSLFLPHSISLDFRESPGGKDKR